MCWPALEVGKKPKMVLVAGYNLELGFTTSPALTAGGGGPFGAEYEDGLKEGALARPTLKFVHLVLRYLLFFVLG